MNSASTFLDALGRKDVADALSVGPTAVSNAAVSGTLPASWYVTLGEMAERRGIEFPAHLFRMRRPSTETSQHEGSLPDTDIGTETERNNTGIRS